MNTIAILVVFCFLIAISRAWELIGGPEIGIAPEVIALARGHGGADDPRTSASTGPRPSGTSGSEDIVEVGRDRRGQATRTKVAAPRRRRHETATAASSGSKRNIPGQRPKIS